MSCRGCVGTKTSLGEEWWVHLFMGLELLEDNCFICFLCFGLLQWSGIWSQEALLTLWATGEDVFLNSHCCQNNPIPGRGVEWCSLISYSSPSLITLSVFSAEIVKICLSHSKLYLSPLPHLRELNLSIWNPSQLSFPLWMVYLDVPHLPLQANELWLWLPFQKTTTTKCS